MTLNARNAVLAVALTALAGNISGAEESRRDRLNLGAAGNDEVARVMRTFQGRGATGDTSAPTPPDKALKLFHTHDDFTIDLVAAEPMVAQPLFLAFDHRARLWVVQYLQYPFPAGLKVVKYDEYLRAVFDKVPAPPPNHVPGLDTISVFEDSDGDGTYDRKKDVITGLNIATAVAFGRGGIWVLNPPYLLFYPDRDGDDVPDGPPEVHLRGFGLEDTHSVASSLRWGPDGWLYGSNGSTTTARISSAATKDVAYLGQCVWRYHPETHVFEIFAEGGGNTFSLELDAKGRLFSGTNSGSTRGMHYVQGGYASKTWGKHGPLTNPYAFGFYGHMRHQGYNERFTQTLLVYEGGAFPTRYAGTIISANGLQHRIDASLLLPDTSSFRTKDLDLLVSSDDRWFRPVDIKAGPDGAVYVADWYDSRLTHVDPRDNWHKTSGRIYRLAAKTAPAAPLPRDLSRAASTELLELLRSDNKWLRQEILRVLGDRRDRSVLPRLRSILRREKGQAALEALWALNLGGGFDEAAALGGIDHPDPHVRRWAIRLVGDSRRASSRVAAALARRTAREPDAEVRSQLASSAKRLPAAAALPIIKGLLARSEDVDDLHIPLLEWWALESKAVSDREAVRGLFAQASLWRLPIVQKHVLARLIQRYALGGGEPDFALCAWLLEHAPDEAAVTALLTGLESAFKGKALPALPDRLRGAMASARHRSGAAGLALGVRAGDPGALAALLRLVADEAAPAEQRLALLQVLAEVRPPQAAPVLMDLLGTPSPPIRSRVLTTLGSYEDPAIGTRVLALLAHAPQEDRDLRTAALGLLASRKPWALALLNELDAGRLRRGSIPPDTLGRMKRLKDAEIDALLKRHGVRDRGPTDAEKQTAMARLGELVRHGGGDTKAGKTLFTGLCAPCHRLFGEGGAVGPELTGYERTNLDFLLLAIVDPSAGLREEYVSFAVSTRDGRTLTGFLADQNDRMITLKTPDGQVTLIPRSDVASLQALPESLMPEGLVTALEPKQVTDLFSYLMMPAGAR